MELETRLKSAEEEITKSQQERYQLSMDIDWTSANQTELLFKIKETEDVMNTCV